VFAYEEEINHWLANLAEEPEAEQMRAECALASGRRRSQELTAMASGMWETRSERNIRTIADLYRKAIDDDSQNAAAYAGLANTMVFCALNDVMDGVLAYPPWRLRGGCLNLIPSILTPDVPGPGWIYSSTATGGRRVRGSKRF
jgi:hypothetical protein